MLISKVTEVENEVAEGLQSNGDNDQHIYNEGILDRTLENNDFNDQCPLSGSDLVFLYKNIDLDTETVKPVQQIKKRPNQYVENVVYNGDQDSDEMSDIDVYGTDDVERLFEINDERLDLISNIPSIENTLCHKCGNLEMHTLNLTSDYDKQLLYKKSFSKDKWNSEKLISKNQLGLNVLPVSLMEYLSSQNLEDTYDFYMDNVITYVKHTIEQLKRISNGDYLTERLREKWVESDVKGAKDNMRVIARTTSIPLQIACKNTGQISNWDEVIHSAIDMKSLSKVIEKRIIIEIPKLIPLPYKLFTKHRNENLVVSCKIDKDLDKKANKSRLSVLFSLKRSESGRVLSNINSLMILNTPPDFQLEKPSALHSPCKLMEITQTSNLNRDKMEIIELSDKHKDEVKIPEETIEEIPEENIDEIPEQSEQENETSLDSSLSMNENETENDTFRDSTSPGSDDISSASSLPLKDILNKNSDDPKLCSASSHRLFTPDELRKSIVRLNKQANFPEDIPEETVIDKSKSPNRIRIKSPYQNKSQLIEEKKRKKLLEIRQQREKKKVAMNKSCKINKQKYGKGAAIPHGSNSVTKLSITNKYFYSSIYGGNNLQVEEKPSKITNRKIKFPDNLDEDNEYEERNDILTPDKNSKKYINRSYYLDDAITEVMCMGMKEKERKDAMSESTSVTSNDTNANLKFITQFINPSSTNLNDLNMENVFNNNTPRKDEDILNKDKKSDNDSRFAECICTGVPSNSPIKDIHIENTKDKKAPAAIECRKSIENVYDLIKQLKSDHVQLNVEKNGNPTVGRKECAECSDSNTSFNHYMHSFEQSSTNFDELSKKRTDKISSTVKDTSKTETVVPKVVISTKSTAKRTEESKNKRERKKITINAPIKASPNPLKAISQLLHEFENIQKTRQKISPERKVNRKSDPIQTEVRNNLQTNPGMRHSRLDQPMKVNVQQRDRFNRSSIPKEIKTKQNFVESPKVIHQTKPSEEKHGDRLGRRKIADIIDEAKEAKGEAVRGPSKLVSRLETLAQPKKCYVQAHSAEYQNKYGRNLLSDRLQRLATAQTTTCLDGNTWPASTRNRRRRGPEVTSLVSVKHSAKNQSPERVASPRRSSSSSPNRKTKAMKEHFLKLDHVPVSPKSIMKNMKAVETYVKSHYGGGKSDIGDTSLGAYKPPARPPLIPTDIELSSISSPTAEESTALGSKLHLIINTIVGPDVFANDSSDNKNQDDEIKVTKESKCCSPLRYIPFVKGPPSLDSDFPVDIFQDKNVLTAVEGIVEDIDQETKKQVLDEHSSDLERPNNSSTALDEDNNNICRKISLSNFPKRLRFNKLTLNPKHSLQRLLLLQSGDAATLVMKSQHDLEITSTNSDKSPNLKLFPTMSAHINWGFTNIPMQVSTVGYSFPRYNKSCTSSEIKFAKDDDLKILNKYFKKSIQTANKWASKNSGHIKNYRDESNLLEEILVNSNHDKEINVNFMNSKSSRDIENITPAVEVKDTIEIKNADIQVNTEVKDNVTFNGCNNRKEDEVGFTESLDMLVGLLNEIQKITTCQTHMTSNVPDKDFLEFPNKASRLKDEMKNDYPEMISLTSLDRLRQLESSPSILSSSDSNENRIESVNRVDAMCDAGLDVNRNVIYADKEVGTGLAEKEYCNTFTNVPSRFLPIMETHSTNISNSRIGIISEPSSQSLLFNKISKPLLQSTRNIIDRQINKFVIIHQNCDIKMKEANEMSHNKFTDVCKNQDILIEPDHAVNMKRDILVTVYSILVITVFAALSIPEMLLTYDY